MAEIDPFEAIVPEVADHLNIRDKLVVLQGQTDLSFEVGQITLVDGSSQASIVLITEVGDQLLVGVPAAVWHKKVAKRLLPRNGLTKPLFSSVVACAEDSREAPSSHSLKMWIGLLHPDLEDSIEFDSEVAVSHYFLDEEGQPALPYGLALVEIASEKFSFLTADSGVGGGIAVEIRLQDLEKNLGKIQESLELLLQRKQDDGPPPAAAGLFRGQPKKSGKPPSPATHLKGLDAGVVNSALSAGIPEAHLAEVAGILNKQPGRMGDLPRETAKKHAVDPLSESEEDGLDLEEEAGADPSADGGVAKAIVQLTKVCSALAAQKTSRSKDPIDRILDQSSSSASQEGFGSGSSRRNAAALQALRRSLTEKPQYIYSTIESRLQEDFASRPSQPGQPLGGATVRGWLESRSRIQNYIGHVRWSWNVGQIWQCLVDGKNQEARARAALLVAAADQAAVDNGSWLLSQVLLLESPPPYAAFQNHQPPTAHELPHSNLIDPRWMELFVSHVREVDSFQEAKKRLGKGGSGSGPSKEGSLENVERVEKPKPKGKSQARKEGGDGAE